MNEPTIVFKLGIGDTISIDAMPSFSDIASGATHTPTEVDGPVWIWAQSSHAFPKILEVIGADLKSSTTIERQTCDAYGHVATDHITISWRGSPLRNADEHADRPLWGDEEGKLRQLIGDDGAPAIYFERNSLGIYGAWGHHDQYVVVLNRDGTRAIVRRVA